VSIDAAAGMVVGIAVAGGAVGIGVGIIVG